MKSLNIVFVEPEIPFNTGSLVRSCGLSNCGLHLIKPLGFDMDNSKLKRVGLDYWELTNVYLYDSFEELLEKYSDRNFYYATTKTNRRYTDVEYKLGDFIVFGKETKGLSSEILDLNPANHIKIPMLKGNTRSKNLSNSANIIMYEALRQFDFPGLE